MLNFFKTEGAKLREMNFAQKRQYIWDYYKLHIIGLLIFAFVVGSLVNTLVINPPMREYLYVAWFGQHANFEAINESLSSIVNNPDHERVLVMSYANTGNPQVDMGLQMRFSAMIHAGSIDLIIAPREDIEDFTSVGFVRGASDATFREHFAEITYINVDEEMSQIYVISLADAPFFEYFGIDTRELYVVTVANSQKFYEISQALNLFFSTIYQSEVN